ncbi:MAG TPA: HPr-rel-A system PqqD family peptide chaperone [Candidatus Baltobacteraceae bacterium]|jgi:PqqD family protein of HPr-rel-A system
MIDYPKLAAEVELRECAQDVVVYDKRGAKIHVVNATAGAILGWCSGSASAPEIAGKLAQTYGIELERAERDVRAILATLEASGVITQSA